MRRRSAANLLSNEHISLNDAKDWYDIQREMLAEKKAHVIQAMKAGVLPVNSRYFLPLLRLERLFTRQLHELELCSRFLFLSSSEACIQIDFIKRIQNRKKDSLSRAFRSVVRMRGIEKRRFEEDILDNLRDLTRDKKMVSAIANFKRALKLRHWLAHGRYWIPRSKYIADLTTVDIFNICKTLLDLIAALK